MAKRLGILLIPLVLVAAACGDDDDAATTTTGATTTEATTTTEAPTTTAAPSTTGADTGSSSATITISDFDFGDPITVSAGETVTVVNEDGTSHTWTSAAGLWDSGTLAQGEEFSFTFEEPGEYTFFCQIHPSMTGSITVTG